MKGWDICNGCVRGEEFLSFTGEQGWECDRAQKAHLGLGHCQSLPGKCGGAPLGLQWNWCQDSGAEELSLVHSCYKQALCSHPWQVLFLITFPLKCSPLRAPRGSHCMEWCTNPTTCSLGRSTPQCSSSMEALRWVGEQWDGLAGITPLLSCRNTSCSLLNAAGVILPVGWVGAWPKVL